MADSSRDTASARDWEPPLGSPRFPAPTADNRDLKKGEFQAILELVALLDRATLNDEAKAAGLSGKGRGWRAKMLADQCCNDCAHAQNMVSAIIACTESAKVAEPGATRSPEFWNRRAHNYLERYAYILLFAAYALEEVHSGFQASFTEWSHRHWQFKRIIKHMELR